MSMMISQSIDSALKDSIQEHPSAEDGLMRWGFEYARQPLLPAVGSYRREKVLRQYDRHPFNITFRGARNGLAMRVASTPWEIKAGGDDAERWQSLLMAADFGSWDRFIFKSIRDWARHDQGTFWEIIGPGKADGPITGAPTGLAVLDSMRCWLTGDPTYPVIYYDYKNTMHKLHRSRVVQTADGYDSDDLLPDIGESPLSRAIAAVNREILMEQYEQISFDDKPPPGIMLVSGWSERMFEAAVSKWLDKQGTDAGNTFGRLVSLFTQELEQKGAVEFYSYSKPPDGYDTSKATEKIVRQVALSMGLDIQDIWELSGSNIGSAAQSEILAQKSRGKGFGHILKRFERAINQALPEDVEFSWKYEDPQADKEEAENAATWTGSVLSASSGGLLTADEGRQILSDKVQAVQNALIDDAGQIARLSDDDPKAADQVAADAGDAPAVENPAIAVDDGNVSAKAFGDTASRFERRFESTLKQADTNSLSSAFTRMLIRDDLASFGLDAWNDGYEDGGGSLSDLDALEKASRNREIGVWIADNNSYITGLADKVRTLGSAEITRRARLWANKSLREIYFAGMLRSGASMLKEWIIDPVKENCETCVTLNGQVHTVAEYMDNGWYPGSPKLACKGFECGCTWRNADKAHGQLPGGATSGFGGFFDRIGRIFRGLFG